MEYQKKNKNTANICYSSLLIKTPAVTIPKQIKDEFSSELYELKIKKAKLEVQTSEITVEILKTELATKKKWKWILKEKNCNLKKTF